MKVRPPGGLVRRAGFTLIEVMVALGLFGLIALAGFTLLDGVIGTRDRLEGRLTRTAELQRALYLISADFEALDSGPLELSGNTLGFRRRSATGGGGSTAVQYSLINGGLHRQVGNLSDQRLIDGVTSVEWRFHSRDQGWSGQPPGSVVVGAAQGSEARADAVALTVVLADSSGGLEGRLRRVVALPALP
jgi:general secretion pathway protein J